MFVSNFHAILSLTANVQHLARINNLLLKLKLADEILNLSF